MAQAGWYPDPNGSNEERYWDGTAWTGQSRLRPTWGSPPSQPTAPLPFAMSKPTSHSDRKWYGRKGFIIPAAIVGVLVVLGGLGSVAGSSKKASESNRSLTVVGTSSAATSASPPTTASATTPLASPTGVGTLPSSVAAAPQTTTSDDGSFIMPNEVGKVLQDAQDDIQSVSEDPIFFSHSHDLLGSRFQVLDRDWKVCTQNVPAGAKASAVEHIDFGVVKLSESCP